LRRGVPPRCCAARATATCCSGPRCSTAQAYAGEALLFNPCIALPNDGDAAASAQQRQGLFDVASDLHARDAASIATQRDSVSALLRRGLLARVPPPDAHSATTHAAADGSDDEDDDAGDESDPRSQRGQLSLEVRSFVDDFCELLAAKLVATPVDAAQRVPLDCVPERSITAEGNAGVTEDIFGEPVSLLRVRMRAMHTQRAAAADAAARVPPAWGAACGPVLAVCAAVVLLLTWTPCAWFAAAALRRLLPAALAAILPAFALAALRAAASLAAGIAALLLTRSLLLTVATDLMGCASLSDGWAAWNRASYLLAARAARWRVPLLRDAAALEARCTAVMRTWMLRALLADMRDAVGRQRVGARRVCTIMAALKAAAASADAEPSGDIYVPMPGDAADAEAFLGLRCDEESADDAGACAIGLAGLGTLIQGALEGDAAAVLRALPPAAPHKEEGGDAARPESRRERAKREHAEAAQAQAAAADAPAKRRARAQQPATPSREGLDQDEDEDAAAEDALAHLTAKAATSACASDAELAGSAAPAAAAPRPQRSRDGGGWRSVEEKAGGWRFLRRRGHVLFRRDVVLSDGARGAQTFMAACTPSDVRSGRNAAAALRRLDRGVTVLTD
jgi:hypothetical protein